MKKDLKENIQFGQNIRQTRISCDEARKVINEVKNNSKPLINNLILAMEHTRVCRDCGEYLLK